MAAINSTELAPNAPSSPGSTIDDPELERKPQAMDSETEDTAIPQKPGLIDRNSSPPKSAGKEGRGKRGRFEKKPRRSKGTPKNAHLWIQEGPQDGTEDDGSVVSSSAYQKPDWLQGRSGSPRTSDADIRHTVGTAVGTRRQANGTVGSVYSGSKIRHIKKDDGTPLWRKDIQYEFLRTVVEDKTAVFTRISDGQKGCNFADIYIDAMARSSKTSKVLKDRLHSDREAAQNMAMICLLVNVGRMNTTLNFFPEMRAQLRTYHSIPSLQAYKSQKDYKSLQDAPRLKSILKGASEDNQDEPRTLQEIQQRSVPRTNPVNLIFILSQYAPQVSKTHFIANIDFFDLVIRHTITSKSRARAFLWLMWHYLEGNFDLNSCRDNPFGPGEFEDQDVDELQGIPEKVPALGLITDEEGNAENIDPEEEQLFAERMQKERKRLIETEPSAGGIGDPESKLVQRWRAKMGASEDPDTGLSDVDSIGGRDSPAVNARGSPAATTPTAGRVQGVLNSAQAGNPSFSVMGGMAESLDDDWEAIELHPGRGRYKRTKANTANRRKRPRADDDTPVVSRSGRPLNPSARLLERATPISDFGGTPQPNLVTATLSAERDKEPLLVMGGDRDGRSREERKRRGRDHLDENGGTASSGGKKDREGHGMMERADGKRRPRPMTQHQRALEEHKRDRVEWVMRGWKKGVYQRRKRERESLPFVVRVARRVERLPAGYDSEEEDGAEGGIGNWGLGGLLGSRGGEAVDGEVDDYGEEVERWVKTMHRTGKRLGRWGGGPDGKVKVKGGVVEVRDVDGDLTMMDGDGDVEADGDADGETTMMMREANDIPESSPPPTNEADLAGLDDIDRSLLAERSDDEMADEGEEGEGEDGDGEGQSDGEGDESER